jgi:hypothetical protein
MAEDDARERQGGEDRGEDDREGSADEPDRSNEREGPEEPKGSGRAPRLTARQAVSEAREQLTELMGRPVEAVLGVERNDEGWDVRVQVVELSRIPNSTDVLGSYNVTVNGDGEVVGYRRTRRYYRSQPDED